jgi:hypothetical protein
MNRNPTPAIRDLTPSSEAKSASSGVSQLLLAGKQALGYEKNFEVIPTGSTLEMR